MKTRITFFLLIALFVTEGFSQDYMDKIVQSSCDCIGKLPDTLKGERMEMQLGLCMIEAALPYSKQIKKDYKIDLSKLDTEGEKLGEILGLKMLGVCPEAVMKMAEEVSESEEKQSVVEEGEKTIEGTITLIEDDNFVTFHLKESSGKVTKFYWFTFIESNRDMINQYKSFTGRTVQIIYKSREFFDPRIGEYRNYQVISRIDILK